MHVDPDTMDSEAGWPDEDAALLRRAGRTPAPIPCPKPLESAAALWASLAERATTDADLAIQLLKLTEKHADVDRQAEIDETDAQLYAGLPAETAHLLWLTDCSLAHTVHRYQAGLPMSDIEELIARTAECVGDRSRRSGRPAVRWADVTLAVIQRLRDGEAGGPGDGEEGDSGGGDSGGSGDGDSGGPADGEAGGSGGPADGEAGGPAGSEAGDLGEPGRPAGGEAGDSGRPADGEEGGLGDGEPGRPAGGEPGRPADGEAGEAGEAGEPGRPADGDEDEDEEDVVLTEGMALRAGGLTVRLGYLDRYI